MSQHRGNDLAATDRNANTDAANPPTLPPNTRDTDIDDLLQQFEHWIKQPNSTLYRHHDFLRTKAAITKKLNEARIDELMRLNTLVTAEQFHVPSRYKVYSYISNRKDKLQATKENNHGDSE